MNFYKKIIFFPLLFSYHGFSQISSYTIDKDHTRIAFEATHLMFSQVEGNFQEFSGEFDFDPKDFSQTQIKAKAFVESLTTNQEKRDNHLKSPDFFDSKNFPEITFESKKVEKIDGKTFSLVGMLTMHGVSKEISFSVKHLGVVRVQGKERVGFTAEAQILRQDFKINFSGLAETVPIVGDQVTLKITAQGIKKG